MKELGLWQKNVICGEFVKKTEARKTEARKKRFKGSMIVAKFARCVFFCSYTSPYLQFSVRSAIFYVIFETSCHLAQKKEVKWSIW